MKTVIKAALFDLDGTLIDTESLYARAVQKVIDEYGNGKKYDWDVRKKVMGGSRLAGGKIVVDAYDVKLSPEEFIQHRDDFLAQWFPACTPMPGAMELTHKLKHEHGLKAAVATSSCRKFFDAKTSAHQRWFSEDFDLSITGDNELVKRAKPAPDIFCVAAAGLGVRPEECIVFEDSVNGVTAALAAKAAIVIGIPDSHVKQEMSQVKFDPNVSKFIIIDSLSDFDLTRI